MRILFTGGGTGGHIMPIVAVVREIRRIAPENKKLEFYYLGPKDSYREILLSQEGIIVKSVFAGKIRRYYGWKSILENLLDIFIRIPIGILQSFFHIFFLAPDLIFSKGGYGSFGPTISGWILQVPIILHESDVSPGLVNRVMGRLASKIFVSFPKTEYFKAEKTIIVGNPIRKEILEGNIEEGKKRFKLVGNRPLILLFGGSQGAQKINDLVLEILPDLVTSFEVIHIAGEKNFRQVEAESKVALSEENRKYYHLYPFLKEVDIKHAYKAANLIVGRAGSGTIFEIAALGKPSILIPLSQSAQNHQIKNAYAYQQFGACIVIEEENFKPHFFLEKLKYLFSHPEELEKMSSAAKNFAKPEAARQIAQYLISWA